MDYVAQGGELRPLRPGPWAAAREAEGTWFGVSAPDHVTATMGAPVPWAHAVVTLTEMACATGRLHLHPAFANNLTRSPVEFAQIALALQHLTGGRFEAALGAGWDRRETEGMGLPFPDGPARARRFVEALRIVGSLLREGSCRFRGEHYEVDVDGLAPLDVAPVPLVAAVAGPWTMRHVPPLVDRVELALPGVANPMRDGRWDPSRLAALTWDDIARSCDAVRAANPSVAISCGVLVGVGTPAAVGPMKAAMGDGLLARFFGAPEEVAEHLRDLTELGIDRVTLMGGGPDGFRLLAPHLRP